VNPGTSLKIGTGSMGAIFAEKGAWISLALTIQMSSECLKKLWWQVSYCLQSVWCKIRIFIFKDNITAIYTSGRKCNFPGKGCESDTFQPINVNGWFWAGANNTRIPATNDRDAANTHWSNLGEYVLIKY